MRTWKVYGAAAAMLLFLASGKLPGTDVGRLEPVEAVQVCRENGQIILKTDTGQWGRGTTTKEALEDLKETASREVFLETAVWLLLDPDLQGELPELTTLLRPNCRLCLYEGGEKLGTVARYLDQQKLHFFLKQWEEGKIPSLYEREGRLYLEQGR